MAVKPNDISFLTDSFTEASSDTLLENHTPDTGNGYIKIGYSGTNGSANELRVDYVNDYLEAGTGGLSQGVVYGVSPAPQTANQYMQGKVSAGTADDTFIFFLRISEGVGGDNFYALVFGSNSSSAKFNLVKLVNGTPTQLEAYSLGEAPYTGDTVRFEVEDDILRVFKNGVLIHKLQDSDVTAAGAMAIGAGQYVYSGDDLVDQKLDDFECGDLEPATFHDGFQEPSSDTTLASHTPNEGSSWTKVDAVLDGTETMEVITGDQGVATYETGGLSDGVIYKANIVGEITQTIQAIANLRGPGKDISAKANISATTQRSITAKGSVLTETAYEIEKPTFGGITMPFPDEARIIPMWTSAENLRLGGTTSLGVMARKYQYIMRWDYLKIEYYDAIEAVINALDPATFVYQKWPQSRTGILCLGSLSERRLQYGTGKTFFLSSVTLTLIEVENRI